MAGAASKPRAAGKTDAAPFCPIEEAIAEFHAGRFVVITADEYRGDDGNLVLPAQFVTPDAINFMTKYGRGLVCMAMTGDRLDTLGLRQMVDPHANRAPFGTAFTVSVEARRDVTTGISASDRARTVSVLIDPESTLEDLVTPGHIFPVRARDQGVLVRAGQTEAAVDLCRLAGLLPGAVICEILKGDGTLARLPDLTRFSKRHGIKMIAVEQIIRYRFRSETLVERVTEANLPTRHATFRAIAYRAVSDADEHMALVLGDVSVPTPVLVRVHAQCMLGDVLRSRRCDCRDAIDTALERIAAEGRGVFVYMRQGDRGIDLHGESRPTAERSGRDTVGPHPPLGSAGGRRDYGIGMQILRDLGVSKIRLLTNNPATRPGLSGYGLEVVEHVPIAGAPSHDDVRYLPVQTAGASHLGPQDESSQP